MKHNFVFPLEEWEGSPPLPQKEWEGFPPRFKGDTPIPDEYDSDESIEIYVNRIEKLKRLSLETDSLKCWHELDLISCEKEWGASYDLGFESLTKQQWELCTKGKQQ